MRMNLLPRLRHILSQCRPQAPVVLQCIDILIRIVRHSPQMAYEVPVIMLPAIIIIHDQNTEQPKFHLNNG